MASDPRLAAIAEREAEERRLRLARLLDRFLAHPEIDDGELTNSGDRSPWCRVSADWAVAIGGDDEVGEDDGGARRFGFKMQHCGNGHAAWINIAAGAWRKVEWKYLEAA